MFHKRGRFGLEKVQNSEIHVKVVLDMECGNIKKKIEIALFTDAMKR